MNKSFFQLTLFGVLIFAADYLFVSLIEWNLNPGDWRGWAQVLATCLAVSWTLLLSTAKDPKEFRPSYKLKRARSFKAVEIHKAKRGQLA